MPIERNLKWQRIGSLVFKLKETGSMERDEDGFPKLVNDFTIRVEKQNPTRKTTHQDILSVEELAEKIVQLLNKEEEKNVS